MKVAVIYSYAPTAKDIQESINQWLEGKSIEIVSININNDNYHMYIFIFYKP